MRAFRDRFRAMGSPCELQIHASSESEAREAARLVRDDVERLEQRYSRYRDDSLLSEINRTAARGGTIDVDDETVQLLEYADTCHRQSDGAFDITSGVLRAAWRFDGEALPEPDRIEALRERIGWSRVDWKPPRLRFPEAGMELDLGGVVKEYAADRAATFCLDAGLRHALVNLGGDVRAVGPRPDGSAWQVGIRHPRRPGELLGTVPLLRGGMASSGDYERCITVGGRRYGHVLDPRTGWPVRHLASVTVIAELCVVAGSTSTIAMLREAEGPTWLREAGLPHLWVDVNGRVGGSLLARGAEHGA